MKGGIELDSTVTNAIYIGAGVLLSIVVITMGVFLARSGRNVSAAFSDRMASMNTSIEENSILKYDGEIVTGSDVVNFIRRNKNELKITVYKMTSMVADTVHLTTGFCTQSYDYQTVNFINLPKYATDDSASNADQNIYINPNGKFLGSIVRNGNDVITEVVFVQQEWINDAADRPVNNTTIVMNGLVDGSSSLSDVEARMSSVEASMRDLASAMNDLATLYADNSSSMQGSMQTLMNQMQDEIRRITSQDTGIIVQLQRSIERMQEKLNELSADGGSDVVQRLSNIEVMLRALQDALGTSKSAAEFNEIGRQLDALDVEISDLSEIGDGSIVDELDTVTKQLKEVQSHVSTMESCYRTIENTDTDEDNESHGNDNEMLPGSVAIE